MSVWPDLSSPSPSLHGTEGELVSVRISIPPRLLEQLLDVLARLEFPINPQIYHNAVAADVYPDGSEAACPATVVEFPAWAGRLGQVREALRTNGLDAAVSVRDMLAEIHSNHGREEDAPHRTLIRCQQAARA